MPDSLSPPSKSQGAAPYVAAIVVLVLLIVALLWYRSSKKPVQPAQTPVVETVSAVAQPPSPAIDIPIPTDFDAGEEDVKDAGKPKKKGKVGPSLCGGPCNGSASPALRSALRGTAASARGCYERALRTNSMLQGRIVVAVRVASTGKVCSANIVSDSVGSSQVSSCVLAMFRNRKFPGATKGRCVDLQVPMNFKPKEK